MYNLTTTIKNGGLETFNWEVGHELFKRGIDVEIIGGEGKYIKYNELKIRLFYFISRKKIWNFGNRFRKWWERVSFFYNNFTYLKQQQYDYIIFSKPLDFFVAYFMKRVNPNIKTIFVSGGEDFYGFDIFFSKYIDFMFAVSKDNQKIIEKRYKREIKVLHNGVDTELFIKDDNIRKLMREKFNLVSRKVLLSIGRLVGLKGHRLVIEILPTLPKDFVYILIGQGEEEKKLKKLVKELNLENRVYFLGEIDNKELYKYINMADLFVQPSIGNEAFGITLVEAMACGLPVIASKNGGMIDIINDRCKCGYLFENKDKNDLKEKILKAINQIFNPREYVIKNFTWKKTVDRLIKEIE
jgi:glycosyltransferase involved in cell wall biosynthesis